MAWLAALLERLDRRVIYLVVAVAIIIPLLWPMGLPITVSKPARDFYDGIESIPDGSAVLLAMDYDPTGIPELYPMNLAVLRHMLGKRASGEERNLKIIGFSLWPAGPPLARKALAEVAEREFGKTYGVDYINLGFKEGREIVMANMASSIPQVWPSDIDGRPLAEFPIMNGIRRYDDIAYLVNISAGYPGIKEWVQQVVSIHGLKMVGGTTGVSAPEYYPYYQSHQLLGLLEGLKGAAEYEKLIGIKGSATAGMDAQSTGHWVIALFIGLGNLIYFLKPRGSR
jgi:hypothetical protein